MGTVAVAPVVAPIVAAPVADPAEAQPVSVPVSASVQAFAAKHNIDLATVTGTGSRGRITRKDLEAIVAATVALAPAAPAAVGAEIPAAPVIDAAAPLVAPPPAPGVFGAPDTGAVGAPVEHADTAPIAAPVVDVPAPVPAAPAVSAPTQPVSDGLKIRVPIDLSDGHKFAFDAETDLAALAQRVLPALTVLSAFIELTAEGPGLIATVSATAAVSL